MTEIIQALNFKHQMLEALNLNESNEEENVILDIVKDTGAMDFIVVQVKN